MKDIVISLKQAKKLHTDGVVLASGSVIRVFEGDSQISPAEHLVWDLTDNWLYYMHKAYDHVIEIPEHLIWELAVISDPQARLIYFNMLSQSGEINETV